MGLEFPLDRSTRKSVDGGSIVPDDAASPVSNEAEVAPLLFMLDADGGGADNPGDGGHGKITVGGSEGAAAAAGLQLLSEASGANILLRARRKIPVVGSSGQPIMAISSLAGSSPAAATAADGTAREAPRQSGGVHNLVKEEDGGRPTTPSGQQQQALIGTADSEHEASRNSSLEVPDAARTETRDMVVHVYWDGAARDRAYVEAFPAKGKDQHGVADEAGQSQQILRLAVRVPTLAIVDAKAASKFAERVVQQMTIQIDEEKAGAAGGRKARAGQPQQRGQKLRLAGVDKKSVVSGN